MTQETLWFVGETYPVITDTLYASDGETPYNLTTASSVVFNARAVGSSTLAVSSPATILSPKANGNVQYQWQSSDVADPGMYLVWWDVTDSGGGPEISERLIEIRAHDPLQNCYVELEQVKKTLNLSGQEYADMDIQAAIVAASRSVDNYCHRRFWLDADNTSVQYFDPQSTDMVSVDDIVVVSQVALDTAGNGTFATVLTSSMYDPGPYNAASINWPYTFIHRRYLQASFLFPDWIPKSVRVTGQFGWPEVPGPVADATAMLAHRFIRRKREAPFSIMTIGQESARGVRIEQTDPDVGFMLQPYIRGNPFF